MTYAPRYNRNRLMTRANVPNEIGSGSLHVHDLEPQPQPFRLVQLWKRIGLATVIGWTILTCVASVFGQDEALPPVQDIKSSSPTSFGPLLYRSQFPEDRWQWTFADPSSWRWSERGTLELHRRESEYAPPHRSPLHMALLAAPPVGNFRLDVEVKSTNEDYGHRDVCFFFGFTAPDRFYYAHLGKVADQHCNQIFLVDAADRTRISTRSTDGTPWDDQWHHVRIERKVESGSITVYFDDMTTPIMTAVDNHHGSGRVGIGTFDDVAEFRKVELWGERVAPESATGKDETRR